MSPGLLLTLVVLVSLLLVWPFGEYPIGDSWTYDWSLQHFLETGRLRILDFNPMTLVGHVAWGALFTLPFGFSFTVARLSTLVLLAAELWAVLAILKDQDIDDSVRTAIGLTLIFQPIHFFQSFQYCTDIPCIAWSCLALLAYSRGLARSAVDYRWLVAGSVFGSLSFLVRQPGIFVVGAMGLYTLVFARRQLRDPRFLIACFGVPVAAVAAWYLWYTRIHGSTSSYAVASSQITRHLAATTLPSFTADVYGIVATVASFVLPIVLSIRPGTSRVGPRARIIVLAFCSALAIAFAYLTFRLGLLFPYVWNNITKFGLLSPNEMIVGDRVPLWPQGTDWVLTFAVLAGALVLVRTLAAARSPSPAVRLTWMLGLLQLVYFVLAAGISFDRHMLILLPTVLLLLASGGAKPYRPVFAVLVGVFAFYSIVTSHDWHSISRAASRAAAELERDGVDKRFVDAGYAQTGLSMYEQSQEELGRREPVLARQSDAWWIIALDRRVQTRFVVSLSRSMNPASWAAALPPWARYSATPRLDGYQPYRQYSYVSYWPPSVRTLWLLRDARLR